MRNLVDAICEPPRSEDNRASFEHDRVPELLRLIGQRDLVAPESSSPRAGIGASAQPQSSGLGDISASLGQGSQTFAPWRDDSKLRCRREATYPYGDPLAAEALARSPRRQQASASQGREAALQTPAAVRAYAWPAYQGHGKTAAGDNPGAEVSGPPDKHPLPWWPRVPGGVGLILASIVGSVRAYAWQAYQGHGKTAAGDNPGAEVSGPPDKHPLPWWPRVPGGVGLILASIVGSVLIGALAAVSYYALDTSNTPGPPPVIAYSSIKAKATAAAQNNSDEARNEQAPTTSRSDQPNKVRTVTIRPDVGAANMSAAESSTNVESELNTSPVPRAYPNSAERRDVGAASTPAAAFSDPRSEPNVPPASRAGMNADARTNVRASAARPQVAARSGGIACQASRSSGGYWAWRLIDGRKCWYEGKPGTSKDNLRWVRRAA